MEEVCTITFQNMRIDVKRIKEKGFTAEDGDVVYCIDRDKKPRVGIKKDHIA